MQPYLPSFDEHRLLQIKSDIEVYTHVWRTGGFHEHGQNRLACLGACTLHCKGYQKYELSAPVDLCAAGSAYIQQVVPGLVALAYTAGARTSLRDLGNTFTLLSAMARTDCLRSCLVSADASYGLAHCLLSALSFYEDEMLHAEIVRGRGFDELRLLADTVKPDLLTVLNAWLEPVERYKELPSPRLVGESLFGVAWWAFHVTDPETVASLVRSESPTFVPGRVMWSGSMEACALPEHVYS